MSAPRAEGFEDGVVGMLHVPISSILAAPQRWLKSLALPSMTHKDWSFAGDLSMRQGDCYAPECRCVTSSLEAVEKLSVWPFLHDRLLQEASIYEQHGVKSVMIENIAAPYFIRGEQPSVVYWLMRNLVKLLRDEHPGIRIGVQILACSDDWAIDIACRCGLDFIRCESALFEGVRPEGRTPNAGNLARLYMARSMLMAELEKDGPGPQVYVDVQKKHTVFMPGLDSLDVWLENILFQKLEGVIITGRATGCPAEETDLHQAREAIEKAKADSLAAVGMAWAPPLIVGSGVSVDNIAMCKRYADAVIVGSSLKKNGYWENPVDEDRVKRFMDAWHG